MDLYNIQSEKRANNNYMYFKNTRFIFSLGMGKKENAEK